MKKRILFSILSAAAFLISLPGRHDLGIAQRNTTEPDAGLTVSRGKSECNYTMNVGVRPLLFWISWNDVGGGKIVWIEEANGTRGLDLLIGSDPARTPRQINRWGYISERISGSSAELVGIMTQSDEQTINQAKESVGSSDNKHAFKAIRSRVNGRETQSSTTQLLMDENFTYMDVSTLLKRIPAEGSSVRQLRIPEGTDPGFLYAVKEMIHNSVEQYRATRSPVRPKPRQYVYNASLFALSITSSRLLDRITANGHDYRGLIESKFEARNLTKNKTSSFIITYGTDARLSEIPVRIVYLPRWWFRAELLLDEDSGILQPIRIADAH